MAHNGRGGRGKFLWLAVFAIAGAAAVLFISRPAAPPAGAPASPEEAQYPADLGPAFIDVSGYPFAQRKAYALVAKECAACHTLSRAVNAPWSDPDKWRRYVERRAAGRPHIQAREVEALSSFLIYDSRKRKVENAAAFQERQRELKHRFALALQARALKAVTPREAR